jgi:Icc-related predicted phosphoesterase
MELNKMKIALTSDIHLEFADWYPVNPEDADVLVLSGDIMVASDLYGTHRTDRFLEFLKNCANEYEHVVYVMGNHEHYNGDFAESAKLLREACEPHGIHFLDKECVTIKGVTFIGGTLWTDMNKRDELTMYHIRSMMNDFRIVRNSNKVVSYKSFDVTDEGRQIPTFRTRPATFSPEDAVEDHQKFFEYIKTMVEGKPDAKFVVVGHHAPSRNSTHPRYAREELMNGGYSSSLDEFIVDHPQIKVWTHGHTHELFDYMIGETRVVCNPRGYVGHERGTEAAEPYRAKIIEIDTE